MWVPRYVQLDRESEQDRMLVESLPWRNGLHGHHGYGVCDPQQTVEQYLKSSGRLRCFDIYVVCSEHCFENVRRTVKIIYALSAALNPYEIVLAVDKLILSRDRIVQHPSEIQ